MKRTMLKMMPLLVTLSLVSLVVAGCGSSATDKPAAPINESAPADPAKDKPTGPAAPAITYKDGTYEGESPNGIEGTIKVQVMVAGGKITDVKVTEQQETPDIGGKALEKLPVEVVAAQSTKIDSISGATATSTAFKEAVDSALSKAK